MRSIITTKNVDVTYNLGKSNEFKALKGITCEIAAREYIIFFGPSGCGKSTLLYSIFGILEPSAGEVLVKGDSIYKYEPMDLVMYQRKTMGIMYQSFNLIPSLTVLDNVQLPLIFAGLPTTTRERKAMELLDRFGIDHVAHKRPGLLSGGQQQRVSVARSLVNDPEILIADEPVGNLDFVSAEAVMNTLEEINLNDKKTVLLVTHDAKYLPYAHRTFYLDYGEIDRIVPNPEKRQIIKVRPGETIVTEIEQLARIYPYDSPEQLRVKSIINFLTQNLSFDQIVRLEKMTQHVIEGVFSEDQFRSLLTTDFEKGGCGIKPKQASEMTNRMFQVLRQSQDIIRFRRASRDQNTIDLARLDLIKNIHQHMVHECNVEADSQLLERLTKMVTSRVFGYITREEFHQQLRLPEDEGGGGFDIYLAADLSRYLEKLIAQGVSHFQQHQEAKPDDSNIHKKQSQKFEEMEKGLLWKIMHMFNKHEKTEIK
jgi:putative ABC transport system ATP-binding protein